MEKEIKTFVLYHRKESSWCFDGLGAKYAAWRKFGDRATYIPVRYNEPVPQIVLDIALNLDYAVHVFILDFSYPRKTLEDLSEWVDFLQVLDHHITAQKNLEGLAGAHFDMTKSGAVLAWEYFHPTEPVPQLLLHIQDYDLWKFDLPNTEAVLSGFYHHAQDMSEWDRLCGFANSQAGKDTLGQYVQSMDRVEKDKLIESNLKALCPIGEEILSYRKSQVHEIIDSVVFIRYKGYKTTLLNSSVYESDLGHTLLTLYPDIDFSLTFQVNAEGKVVLHFRGRKEDELDVSILARELGGGGHRKACGAKVDLKFLAWLYEKVIE